MSEVISLAIGTAVQHIRLTVRQIEPLQELTMPNQIRSDVHAQSEPYKFGWTIGFYDCSLENGASYAAHYGTRYAQCDLTSFRDFLKGYCDGRTCGKWRNAPPVQRVECSPADARSDSSLVAV